MRTFRRLVVAPLVTVCAGMLASPAQAADPTSGATWVFFRDRAPGTAAVAAEPASPRALARRERARRERAALGRVGRGDAGSVAEDAPPSPAYVARVARAGARVRVESSWLNAVSVVADAATLARVEALPFVVETRPVALLTSGQAPAGAPEPGGSPRDIAAPARGEIPAPPEPGDVADAGPSFAQLDLLGIPEAHAMGYHGEGIVIGILDTGFTLEHEVFPRVEVLAKRDFVQGDDDPSDDRSRSPRDFFGQQNHGTQVLSLLAAYAPGRMIGAAYAASFILAKTERIGFEEPIEEDVWCAGLEWVEAMGADVITTSISYTNWYRRSQLDGRTAVVTRMANRAWERGVVLVNSAGNSGPAPTSLGAPSDAAGEIAVGAVDLAGELAGFSSRGPTADGRVKPDVVGPGVSVLIPIVGTRDQYSRGGGTSYAAPLVAGVAALVTEAHPDWGPEAVREALVMSADRADRPDNDQGWGVVNARAAILYPFLDGVVRAAGTGKPVAGARVAWERIGDAASTGSGAGVCWAAPGDAPPRGETRAGAGGSYTVSNLPPGAYRLTIDADGYEPLTLGPFDVPPNLRGVDATLTPRR